MASGKQSNETKTYSGRGKPPKGSRVSKKDAKGRPDLLKKKVYDRIIVTLEAGNYIDTAAAFAGLHRDTVFEWLRAGKIALGDMIARGENIPPFDDDLPFVVRQAIFTDAVTRAKASAEVSDVLFIKSQTDWKARAWRLERRDPKKWGPRAEVSIKEAEDFDLTGKSDEDIEAITETMTPSQLAELQRRLLEESGIGV